MLLMLMLTVTALSLSVPDASSGQTHLRQQSFAESSQISDIRAYREPTPTPTPPDAGLIAACAEAVEELRAARQLLASQGKQIALQADLLALERQISDRLKNIRTLDAAEKDALRDAIAAKDSAIKTLKKNQMTLLKKVKYLVYGAAAGVVIYAVTRK